MLVVSKIALKCGLQNILYRYKSSSIKFTPFLMIMVTKSSVNISLLSHTQLSVYFFVVLKNRFLFGSKQGFKRSHYLVLGKWTFVKILRKHFRTEQSSCVQLVFDSDLYIFTILFHCSLKFCSQTSVSFINCTTVKYNIISYNCEKDFFSRDSYQNT